MPQANIIYTTVFSLYLCVHCSVAKSCSVFTIPQNATCPASLSFTISRSLLKLMPIEPVVWSNHLILCHPLLSLPSIFPNIRAFSNKSALSIKWPKNWSFSLSISASNEHSGLISFRIYWIDLAVQGTLKNLLKHQKSKVSVLWRPDFFMVQLSFPYLLNGKTIDLTVWTSVRKLISAF